MSSERDNRNPYCPSCGAECDWEECEQCDAGEHEVYDADPLWYDPGDTEPCDLCLGHGGEWWCSECGPLGWEQALADVPMSLGGQP